MSSPIAQLRAAMETDLTGVRESLDRWRDMNTSRLRDEIYAHNIGRGQRKYQADESTEADMRCIRQIIKTLDDAHGWLATLDNNLHEDGIVT